MKRYALIATIIIAALIATHLYMCGDETDGTGTIHVPADTSYIPTTHRDYTPPSPLIGGLTNRRSEVPARLPANVSERDVERVVRIKFKDSSKPIAVLETKSGEVYVEKDSQIERLEVIKYNPPVFAFGLFPGIGVSVAGLRSAVRPMATISFLAIKGKTHLPVVAVDTEGIGFGIDTRVYHDIHFGAGYFAAFEDTDRRMFKVFLQYNF